MADDGKAKKAGPEWEVRIPRGPTRLRRDTPFLCNIRFKNDLPEIPCDPKLLLPPYEPQRIAAFQLTEVERDLQRDLLFEPDLGIPIHPWNVEQYSAAAGEAAPALHPDDAALVQSDGEAEPRRARLRGDAAELSWLLRTKYISAEAGLKRGQGGAPRAPAAAEAPEGEAERRAARLHAIEAQFAAARAPLVHGRDPGVTPVEVLPVFPDALLEGRPCVLATFDNDPLADAAPLEGVPPEARARAAQAMQLKSFKPAAGPQFVALLLPRRLPTPGDDALSAAGGTPGASLTRQYQWVREYNPQPRLDEKGTTFLFRFAGDSVAFHDLNTRLELRKRKRTALDDDGDSFVQPEAVIVRNPETGEWAEQQEQEQQAAGERQRDGSDDGGQQQQQQPSEQQQRSDDGGSGSGGGGGGSAGDGGEGGVPDGDAAEFPEQATGNAALRDAFGDDDDDI